MGLKKILSKMWTPFSKLTEAEEMGYNLKCLTSRDKFQFETRRFKNKLWQAMLIGAGIYTATSLIAPMQKQDHTLASSDSDIITVDPQYHLGNTNLQENNQTFYAVATTPSIDLPKAPIIEDIIEPPVEIIKPEAIKKKIDMQVSRVFEKSDYTGVSFDNKFNLNSIDNDEFITISVPDNNQQQFINSRNKKGKQEWIYFSKDGKITIPKDEYNSAKNIRMGIADNNRPIASVPVSKKQSVAFDKKTFVNQDNIKYNTSEPAKIIDVSFSDLENNTLEKIEPLYASLSEEDTIVNNTVKPTFFPETIKPITHHYEPNLIKKIKDFNTISRESNNTRLEEFVSNYVTEKENLTHENNSKYLNDPVALKDSLEAIANGEITNPNQDLIDRFDRKYIADSVLQEIGDLYQYRSDMTLTEIKDHVTDKYAISISDSTVSVIGREQTKTNNRKEATQNAYNTFTSPFHSDKKDNLEKYIKKTKHAVLKNGNRLYHKY